MRGLFKKALDARAANCAAIERVVAGFPTGKEILAKRIEEEIEEAREEGWQAFDELQQYVDTIESHRAVLAVLRPLQYSGELPWRPDQ